MDVIVNLFSNHATLYLSNKLLLFIQETIRDAIEDSITWPIRKVIPIIPGDYRYKKFHSYYLPKSNTRLFSFLLSYVVGTLKVCLGMWSNDNHCINFNIIVNINFKTFNLKVLLCTIFSSESTINIFSMRNASNTLF